MMANKPWSSWNTDTPPQDRQPIGDLVDLSGARHTAASGAPLAASAFTPEQMVNAALIVRVGGVLGLPRRARAEALDASWVETRLRNLHYGDASSVGLFQQLDSWGSVAQRTNPDWAASAFYVGTHARDGWHPGLTSYHNWASLSFEDAVYQVQRCASQYKYRYGDAAALGANLADLLLPGGSFPLPTGHWFGVDDGTDASHSGARAEDLAHVKQIQRMVGAGDDGDFGPHTEALVAAWKVAHGLDRGGQVGAITWPAMVRS